VKAPGLSSAGDRHSLHELPSNEIHLWLTYYAAIDDERLHRDYWSLLNDAEREQQKRFYFERDRLRYLVTRALVRTVLSRYAPIDPRRWLFSTNAYGRPQIANREASALQLSFNISHTQDLIVLGVTKRRALGVDVENVRARAISIDIADRFFAPAETAELAAVPAHRQQDRFFEYWTFKESYIKARGMGLSLPLDKFSFHYPSDRSVCLSIDSELADVPARWRFWQLRPAEEYLVAVCAEHVGPTDVLLWETVPTAAERSLAPRFLRTSE
jgi:4'-phosphopantetheinyl transferase